VYIVIERGQILMYAEAKKEPALGAPRTLSAADPRVRLTIHPGLPSCVEVAHDGLTEAEVEGVLMDMAAEIPSPCVLFILPRVCWDLC